MKKNDVVKTPRFGNVTISEVFGDWLQAEAAGFTETTHYFKMRDPNFDVLGKPLANNKMIFAAVAK